MLTHAAVVAIASEARIKVSQRGGPHKYSTVHRTVRAAWTHCARAKGRKAVVEWW